MFNFLILITTLEHIIIIILPMRKLRHKEVPELGLKVGQSGLRVLASNLLQLRLREQYCCHCCASTFPPTWTLWLAEVASLSHLTSVTCVCELESRPRSNPKALTIWPLSAQWWMSFSGDFTKLAGLDGDSQSSNLSIAACSFPEPPLSTSLLFSTS